MIWFPGGQEGAEWKDAAAGAGLQREGGVWRSGVVCLQGGWIR